MDKNNYQIALLIDGDNIEAGLFGAIMNELKNFGKVVYKGVYGDFSKAKPRKWAETAKFNGLDLRYESPIKGKNSADILMVIDAMDLLYVNRNINCFCIATSDRDFVGLISRLKKDGIFVVGAFEALANEALKNNYDYQILLNENSRAKREPQTAQKNRIYGVKPTAGALQNGAKQTENKGQNGVKPTEIKAAGAKSAELKPQNDIKPIGNVLQNGVKPIGNVLQNGVKSIGNVLQNEVKPIGNVLQNEVKSAVNIPQNDIKPIGNIPQNEVKPIEIKPQNEIKTVENKPQNEVKSVENKAQNEVKSVENKAQNDGEFRDMISEMSSGVYDDAAVWAAVGEIVAAYKKDKEGYANFAGVLKKLHGKLKNLPTLKVANFEKAFDISHGNKGALIKNKEL